MGPFFIDKNNRYNYFKKNLVDKWQSNRTAFPIIYEKTWFLLFDDKMNLSKLNFYIASEFENKSDTDKYTFEISFEEIVNVRYFEKK